MATFLLVGVLLLSAASCGKVRSGKDITDADKLSPTKVLNTATKIDLDGFAPVMEVGGYLLIHRVEAGETPNRSRGRREHRRSRLQSINWMQDSNLCKR